MNYESALSKRTTLQATMRVLDIFRELMVSRLNLKHIPCPLFLAPESGLNDDLNGIEEKVSFHPKEKNIGKLEVVQSLAKWKRWILGKLGYWSGFGIITDMKAIRKDEDVSNIHSILVDQFDWEMVIVQENRCKAFLHSIVTTIYSCIKDTELVILKQYPELGVSILSDSIYFITSQELEDIYPDLTPKEREHAIAKEKGAVFISEIGGLLKSGKKHDGRAFDYDQWDLNGDIIIWYPPLGQSVELSSMGIRVNAISLISQAKVANSEWSLDSPFHKAILDDNLPFTIGGGIGQSRLAMIMLRKMHIGEVQFSTWPEGYIDTVALTGIDIL